jgi:hypothetical protein
MTILLVALWAGLTALHFALCARFAARRLPGASIDERAWASVLIGVAGLSMILHAAVTLTSLSTISVAVAFVLFHGWLLVAGRLAMPGAIRPAAITAKEAIGAALLLAITLAWIEAASVSAAIGGPDATGYHVPAAVNLARGASLLDLPATQHLYPLAGSTIAAWFLWPFHSPFITDLGQVLPFLVLATSVVWLFRLLTGLPGFAWGVPIVLTLFSMPLFRSLSLGSADLWFGASCVAFVAALVSVHARAEWRAIDLWLAGGAAGLLAGSKTTGIAAGVLIVAAYVAVALAARLMSGPAGGHRRLLKPSVAAGILLAAGAGGVWLLRNWWLFGSPIAPSGVTIAGVTVFPGASLEPTAFRSVRGDVMGLEGYRLLTSIRGYAAAWLAPWFLPVLVLVPLGVVDLVSAKRASSDLRRARVMTLGITVLAGSMLLWLLAGAPWTSLEWSRGFSLRYALPIPALLAVLAASALFPLGWRWYASERAAEVAWAAGCAGAAWIFALSIRGQGGATLPVPPLAVPWLAAAGAIAFGLSRVPMKQRAYWPAALGVGLAMAWAPQLVARDTRAVQWRVAQSEEEAQRFASGRPIELGLPPQDTEVRELWLAVQSAERANGAECQARRWFALGRIDFPLLLQDDHFRSRVFYAGRDPESARRVAPVGPCDYIVTTPALAGTEKGQAIAEILAGGPAREVARTAGLIALIR